jgi:hypothetical protein
MHGHHHMMAWTLLKSDHSHHDAAVNSNVAPGPFVFGQRWQDASIALLFIFIIFNMHV